MSQTNCEEVKFTAFIGRTKHIVEQSFHEFCKNHTVIRAKYEYNPSMQPTSRHAIWVYYEKEDSDAD